MSRLKEYLRTGLILIVPVVIIFTIAIGPFLNFDSSGYDNEPNDEPKDEPTTPTDRNVDGILPPPPDGECYVSVGLMYKENAKNIGQNIGDQIDAFSSMIGKNHTVFFDIWADFWEPEEAFWQLATYKPLMEEGKIRAIGINIVPCVRDDNEHDNYTVKKIANGEYDDFIKEQVKKVKAFEYPVFIRFGAEFNIHEGQIYEGQTADDTFIFGQNPSDFVSAWRHYVDLFRAQNATNAIFIWNPNFADFGPHHYTEYYPGDDYVDWVGVDLYQYEPSSDPATMMHGIYDEYSNRKPIAIVEWGANWPRQNYNDSVRAKFIIDFFDAVESMPQIKLINYWYWQDFMFDKITLPETTAAYAYEVSDQRYVVE